MALISNSRAQAMDSVLPPRDEDLLEIAQELIRGELNPQQDGMMAVESRQQQNMASQNTMQQQPWVQIIEEPKSRGLRFRYECEGRSAGSIPGQKSTTENRTYPSIKIHNDKLTDAIVVVSCVTKDTPPKPHPHSLVGKDCNRGVCTVRLKKTNTTSFPNLGIQCAKKRDVPKSLKERQEIRVDPFNTGVAKDPNSIDLSTVKLCFQVFLPDDKGKFTKVLQPVVSHCIFDKKTVNDLVMVRVSKHSGSCRGGDEIFLLCEKVNKEDIEVRFFETSGGAIAWEGRGEFGQNDVHRQFAIVFKAPAYKRQDITQPVTVYMQLRRMSDGETSEPMPFQYIPENLDPEGIESKRKRKRVPFDNFLTDTDFATAKGDGKAQLREKLRSKSRTKVKEEKPDDYSDSFMAAVQAGNHGLSTVRGSCSVPAAQGYVPAGAAVGGSGQLPSYVFTNASQPTPAMAHMSQVTMASGVTGGMATFTTLNTVTQPVEQRQILYQQQQIKTEQSAEELPSDFPESGSACNSFNLDSGLLQYITDEQADSLTKFLDPTGLIEQNSNPPNVANFQQDPVMMNLDIDNLQDIHNQLSDLN